MQRKNLRKLFCLLSLLLITLSSAAQSIRINGRVLNQKNEPIPGASISVSEINRSFAADVEGRFSVLLEQGKKYTFTVTAVGFQTKAVDEVEVKANEIENTITIVMDIAAKEGTEIIIRSTARKENTSGLLNFQRNNVSLSSGIAADFIRRTPDRNTSEVIKRVSGASIQDNKFVIVRGLSDRYNQAYLNNAQMPSSEPDKKAFSFDIIPSIMIDNIIINKTATPDLTGEFAGGLVQVNTRDVPTKNQLTVGFSTGYNTQSTFQDFTTQRRNSTDWLGFDDGSRGIPSAIPSTVDYRQVSLNQKATLSKSFPDKVYLENRTKAIPITTFNLAWANTIRLKGDAKIGTIISVYHRQSQVKFIDVNRGRYESTSARPVIFEGAEEQNRYTVNTGAMANFTYVKNGTKISFKNLFNQLYEDNNINRLLYNAGRFQDVSLRTSFLNQRTLFNSQLELDQKLSRSGIRLNLNGSFSFNNKTQPDFRTAQYVRASLTPGSDFELDDDDTRRFFSSLKDFSTGLSGSLTIPFKLGSEQQTLKVGGSTLLRYRQFNARSFVYRPTVTGLDLSKPFNEMFLNDNIGPGGLYLDEQTQNTDFYIGASALDAGYVMFDNKFADKFRLIWGVRAEYFQQFLSSRDLSLKRVIVNSEQWDFLPSMNLTYSLSTKQQIRFAASKTVARPEFREIAPFQFFDYEQIWGVAGNTDLKRTSIINVDLRYEYYPRSGEVFSIGALVKDFNDPIELRMDPGSNGDRWLFEYTNADRALLYGGEIEIRKKLDFISSKLSTITFTGNFTYLFSEVTLTTEQAGGAKVDVNRALYGQSPYLLNAGFQYTSKNESWNASILYNRIGPRLYLVGDPVSAGFFDVYENPRNLLDLQVSKRVLKNQGEFKLTVSDVFNNRFLFYDNPTAKINYEPTKGDRITYAYRPGTTITVGFTYDFNFEKK